MSKRDTAQLLQKLNEADQWQRIQRDMENLKTGQEDIFFINKRAYVISPATPDDVKRIGNGHFCMD